ncbi:hypothetical protein L195_g045205 [Trifolium pratense]|uniref:Uncharacterized protein n=1 Tax=Trifolium pratense TaxID=57577 RepID=A0A2K3ME83_TRIPR|nr:hypothetical protein L195_g045205 [Trifolium pratense]
MGLEVISEAFKVIGNPLVIAKVQNNSSEIVCSDAVFVDLTICQKRELILETLFPSRVDTAGEETTTEASDSTYKEFSSNLPNERSASVSDQASDGQIKDEVNMPVDADFFWKWLENVGSASADVSRLASMAIKECLEAHILLLKVLIQNPAEMENKNDMEVLVSLFEDMMQLRGSMSMTGLWMIEKDTLIALSKKILSRRSEVVRLLYKRNVWKESKYDKGKKNKGGKKGKK